MDACRMAAMSDVFAGNTEGHAGPLSFCKSSCFYGSSSHLPVALLFRGKTCRERHVVVVRAEDARKGTGIFKFNRKQDGSSTDEAAETKPGTRFFRFGGSGSTKQTDDDGDKRGKDDGFGMFGTQIFKNVSDSARKAGGVVDKGGALVSSASKELSFSLPRRQDPRTVFVAGATGQIGARLVQKLLRQGLNVRAGVRDLFIAQQLAEFGTQYGVVSREEAKRLNAVEFDFKSVESIAKAIGGAAKAVVTVGPYEDGPKSKVSFEDAFSVVEAAKLANIANLVVVYEPGISSADANPITGLTSFLSDLFSKPVAVLISELLSKVADSNISYTLLKTGLTDGSDDSPLVTQNIVLRKEGTSASLESSKISKGQVADIVAAIMAYPALAENKVIEAFSSASAEASPLSDLLSSVSVDGRREALAAARAQAAEEEKEKAARAKAEADARAAVEESRKAAQVAAKLEAEAKQLAAAEAKAASVAEKAQAQVAAATATVEGLAARIKDLPGPQQLFTKSKGDAPAARPGFTLPSLPPLPTARAKVAPLFSSDVSKKPTSKPKTPAPSPAKKKQREPIPKTPSVTAGTPKPQVNSIFGGLFTQETVYIDEV